jgi:phosphoglucosamine mutase
VRRQRRSTLAPAWLDVNCAHCHRREGPASNSGLFMTYGEREPTALGIMKRPVATGRGAGDRRFDIKPGDPDSSILIYGREHGTRRHDAGARPSCRRSAGSCAAARLDRGTALGQFLLRNWHKTNGFLRFRNKYSLKVMSSHTCVVAMLCRERQAWEEEQMSGRYFGTDGIRGRANKFPMTAEVAMKVGMAAGMSFQRGNHRHRVVLGKDTRLSGYMIENAMVAGFCAAGMDVLLLGPIPTPAVAMLARSLRADIGVMISASHNPYHDNGIKLFGPDGYKLSDEIEGRIESMLDGEIDVKLAEQDALGRAKRIDGAHDRYIEFAKRTLPQGSLSLSGLRIVVDCANGAGYKVAPAALWELGAEVITIHNEPNGFNINQECGSTHPMSLAKKVHEVRADIGIALDGDADRMVIVDENGTLVDGDQIMALIAESWNQNGRLAGGGVVATVMSNLGLERFLDSVGLQLHRTKVGDRYVVEHMRAHGLNVGGEQSGHIVLSDFSTTGDGLVSALQVLACVKREDKPVSEVCKKFEPVPQILKNVRFSGGKPLESALVKAAIEDARNQLGKNGRLVIRPSGTEPLIRVMAEGDDSGLVEKVVNDIVDVIADTKTAA